MRGPSNRPRQRAGTGSRGPWRPGWGRSRAGRARSPGRSAAASGSRCPGRTRTEGGAGERVCPAAGPPAAISARSDSSTPREFPPRRWLSGEYAIGNGPQEPESRLWAGGILDCMSETELSVICKNCCSEVSPYVPECPYCGARLRKRAPKLERRGDALEAQQPRRRRRRVPRLGGSSFAVSTERPYATLTVILGSAILLLVQKATGYALGSF